jgi:phosphoribosylamine---glycine ligase
MKLLVIGAGGREHALAWRLAQSPRVQKVYLAPGNGGTANRYPLENLPLQDTDALVAFAQQEKVGLTVVGPEAPLADGIVDAFRAAGLLIFGPTREAAQLESSKDYAKSFMQRHNIPTAASRTFTDADEARAYIQAHGAPIVVKADGLAAGKGVVIAASEAEAHAALEAMLVERRFGEHPVVVEEFLDGDELSVLAICDGERALPLAPARDFKRIGDGDTGPNTGGMGAFSPVAEIDDAFLERVRAEVHQPVLDELARRGSPFHGVLYAGLMLTGDGPKVLEYNVRFGDPETQAVLPRLRSDLLDLMLRATRPGGLSGASLEWDARAAVTVVLASAGYPESSSSGDVISGLDDVPGGIELTHAGTAERDGEIVTAGGRVLNVTALGDGVAAARAAAYAAADVITFDGRQLRRDIAA